MKAWISIFLGLALVCDLGAQGSSASAPALRTAPELDQLVAPIALYPDPLVALILPASTVQRDIVTAAGQVGAGMLSEVIRTEPWDDSVKGLAHYPEVLQWLAENTDWTAALGLAVGTQQADVMQAIQRLRSRAMAAGNLMSNVREDVVVDHGAIRIIPAQTGSINIPAYDPNTAYSQASPDVSSPALEDGPPLPAGDWLGDCDWADSGIWLGYGGWGGRSGRGRFWQGNFNRGQFGQDRGVSAVGIPRPSLLPRTPTITHFGTHPVMTNQGLQFVANVRSAAPAQPQGRGFSPGSFSMPTPTEAPVLADRSEPRQSPNLNRENGEAINRRSSTPERSVSRNSAGVGSSSHAESPFSDMWAGHGGGSRFGGSGKGGGSGGHGGGSGSGGSR